VTKRFVDLHVLVPPVDLVTSASRIRALNIDVVGLTCNGRPGLAEASTALGSLRAEGVEAHLRLDIDPAQPGRPLRRLTAWRHEFRVIAGAITSTRGLRALLRSNVDILFADTSHSRLLAPGSFKSIARAGKPLELNLRPVIVTRGMQRAYALREMSRQVRLAAEAGLAVVLSSGAVDVWEMRPPREMANILTLLGLDQGSVIETVSLNPLRVLEEACRLGANSS